MSLTKLNNAEILNRVLTVLSEQRFTDARLYEKLGIYEQKWTKWKERGIPADWHFSFSKLLNLNLEWLVSGEGQKYKLTGSGAAKENDPDYVWIAKNEDEKRVLTLFRTMLNYQRQEWLSQGAQLANIAGKIREEIKNEN